MTGNLAITPLARLPGKLSFFTGFFLCRKNYPHFFLSIEKKIYVI
jgi:hypothetical protein